MRLERDDLEALARGYALLGSGGGGSTTMLELILGTTAHWPLEIAPVDALDPATPCLGVAFVGSTMLLGERMPGAAPFAPLLAPFVPTVAPIADDIADPTARERAYPRTPVAGVAALGRIQRAARRALPRITAPVTVYRSARDAVVPASSHRTLVRGLRQAPVEVVGLPRSRHVATLDHDLPLLIDHGRSAVAAMTTH